MLLPSPSWWHACSICDQITYIRVWSNAGHKFHSAIVPRQTTKERRIDYIWFDQCHNIWWILMTSIDVGWWIQTKALTDWPVNLARYQPKKDVPPPTGRRLRGPNQCANRASLPPSSSWTTHSTTCSSLIELLVSNHSKKERGWFHWKPVHL